MSKSLGSLPMVEPNTLLDWADSVNETENVTFKTASLADLKGKTTSLKSKLKIVAESNNIVGFDLGEPAKGKK